MSETITISMLDASSALLKGGTRLTVAMWIETVRGLSGAALRSAVEKAAREAPAGPYRDWLVQQAAR
jgi:hypothetical protein